MHGNSSAALRFAAAIPAALIAVVLLAGCSAPAPSDPAPTTSAPASATPAPSETAEPLALDPAGNAEANLAFFIATSESLLTPTPDSNGRDIIDHLVAAGFDKTQMELTADTTAVGLKSDNIQFSVKMNGDCLIGQSGNVGFHAVVEPLLSTGTCLVGTTRAIDW